MQQFKPADDSEGRQAKRIEEAIKIKYARSSTQDKAHKMKHATSAHFTHNPLALTVLLVLSALPVAASGQAADERLAEERLAEERLDSFQVAPTSVFNMATPIIDIARNVEAKDFQGNLVENALNFNLGVKITPIAGLNLQADAWRQEIADAPAVTVNAGLDNSLPQLYLKDSAINEFNLQNPLIGNELRSSGFDLGASYVWDTNRFGQFTLSTKTTYVEDFDNRGSLLDLLEGDLALIDDRVISPELQSNLMLTWQFGNHTASAITNYFDSFKDISELDIEEINALVDNITTIDLQYGYSVETSSNNRAVISFGIRNIFDEKTAQILNSSTRILDQNGRVAYGSIKYQF